MSRDLRSVLAAWTGAEPGDGADARRSLRATAASMLAAVVLLAVGWPVLTAAYGVLAPVAMVIALGQSAAILLALRWPSAALPASVVSLLGAMVATMDAAATQPWPWPVPTLLAHCAVIVILAFRYHWTWSAGAWAAGSLLTAGAVTFGDDTGLASGIVGVSVSAGVVAGGVLGRLWLLNLNRAERAETAGALESRRRMELQERTRIARELHDVVAHSMSVINVQATTARYRRPGLDEWVQREFDDIADSSRQALGEMRSLLGILRGDDKALTAPLPGLADIPDLVETSRASGTRISLVIDEVEAPPATGVIAYRVIQEAVSNALRHAPGAPVAIRVAGDAGQTAVLVEVVNDPPDRVATPAPGSGMGLAGIRERVHTSGGTVTAGPRDGGGFAVVVRIPVTEHGSHPLPG